MILPNSFYTRTDVITIARELPGKFLVTEIHGVRTSGMIVEVEAYAGIEDRASHAYGGRRTKRTEVMFAQGGVAYVYLCYGLHQMFNVVTNASGVPHAILIRGIEPVEGIEVMLERRKYAVLKPSLTAGPGSLSAALGITTVLTGCQLSGPEIKVEDRGVVFPVEEIVAPPRIGVDYAGEDALLPYRFYIRGNRFVSRAKK